MSYGQVARVLGAGYDARAIGNVMHATPDDGRHIPWHRVINAQGGCSTAGLTVPPDLQQRLLESEGVVFNDKGRCKIENYLWAPPEYEEVRASLDRMASNSQRTSEVFEALRALFGKAGQARQPIDVNEIILGVLQSFDGDLKSHGVTARTYLASGLPPANGHKGQLREVVSNLVSNAIEAMTATSNRNRVLAMKTELRDSDAIVVSGQDSGSGIDPERLDGIFGGFVSTKEHGSGLGLAICRMIIEQHGGQLSATSDGKSGALFQFVLPIDGKGTGPCHLGG